MRLGEASSTRILRWRAVQAPPAPSRYRQRGGAQRERSAEPCAGSTLTPFARRSVSWQNSTSSAANQCCLPAGSFRLEPALRHHAIVMARAFYWRPPPPPPDPPLDTRGGFAPPNRRKGWGCVKQGHKAGAKLTGGRG